MSDDIGRTMRVSEKAPDRCRAEWQAIQRIQGEVGNAFVVDDVHYDWLPGSEQWSVTVRVRLLAAS